MHRTDGANNVANMFVDKVPGVSPGTIVEEDWLNMVQEEIVSVVIDDGTALVKGTNTQLRDAINKFRRTSAVSRVLHLSATDLVPLMASGVYDTRLQIQLSSGASSPSYWSIASGAPGDFYFNARPKLPIGATITGVKVYVYNSGSGDVTLGDVRVRTLTANLAATGNDTTPYTVLEAQAVSTANTLSAGAGAWLTPTGAWTNRTVPSDGFVEMGLRVSTEHVSAGAALLLGVRLTYAEQVIAPAT